VVLGELSQKTGAEFKAGGISVLADRLSVSFADLTFSEAVARVLKHYSYLLEYRKDHSPRVIILTSKASGEFSPGPSGSQVTISGESSGKYIASTSTSPKGAKVIRTNENLTQAPEPLSDLDECERLDFTREDAGRAIAYSSGEGAGGGKQFREGPERALLDARISRAQRVLTSERCSGFWAEVLNDLAGIQDDRVTAILIEAAERGDRHLRGMATKALWTNVAASSFKNSGGLSALNRLAGSSDQEVSMWAKQALQDYQRYLRKAGQTAAQTAVANYEMKGGESGK
jgi:hypothetical protein